MDTFLEPWQVVGAALLAAAAVAAVRRFRGAAADPAVRVLERELQGWKDQPVFDGLAGELASVPGVDRLTVERELEALHFGAATLALSSRRDDPGSVRAAAEALSNRLAGSRDGGGGRGERVRRLRDRAARYERAVPDDGRRLEDDDLRRIGEVLVDALAERRRGTDRPGAGLDPGLLQTVGLYFLRRREAAGRALPAP